MINLSGFATWDNIFKLLLKLKKIIIAHNGEKINKTENLWRVIMAIAIINLYVTFSEYSLAKRDRRIENKMAKFVADCGLNSYMTWVILEGKKYHIKNIVGCVNESRNCLDDRVKFENAIYTEQNDQELDENTYRLAQGTQEGATPHYSDIEELRMYDSFYRFLSKTNHKIEEIGFTVVKDYKKDTIYIFLVSFVEGAAKKCESPWRNLQDFGFEVKRIL